MLTPAFHRFAASVASKSQILTTVRLFTVSHKLNGKARTYESKPVPGSLDHIDPLAWAQRLFDLHEIRKAYTYPSKPSPILMICRVRPIKGTTFFERAFLEKYGIGPKTKQHQWKVVKNTPRTVDEIDRIKYLVRVQPVSFPDGLPLSEDDLINFRLLPNGDFVRRGISPFRPGKPIDLAEFKIIEHPRVSENTTLCIPDLEENPRYLTRDYLKNWHNQRWQHHKLLSEFFTAKYKYRLNQDGQEYRYSGLWRLDDAMRQSLRQRKNLDGTYKTRNNSRFEADWGTYPWAFY
ncbi:39S ribosomal protein L30 mitochondrial [Taenia solium]|eukprot:TsM_000488600 transcript=TsM_000488600 gene=TsM_000488600